MNKKTEFIKHLAEEGNTQTIILFKKHIESLIEDVHESMEHSENDIDELRGEIKAYRNLYKLLTTRKADGE